ATLVGGPVRSSVGSRLGRRFGDSRRSRSSRGGLRTRLLGLTRVAGATVVVAVTVIAVTVVTVIAIVTAIAVVTVVPAVPVALEGDDATDQQVPEGRLRQADPPLQGSGCLGGHLEGHQDVGAVHRAVDRVREPAPAPVVGGEQFPT